MKHGQTDDASQFGPMGANFTSGVGPCSEIVELFKHFLRVTTHPQILALELWAPMGTCSRQYDNCWVEAWTCHSSVWYFSLSAACKDEGVQQSILETVQGVDKSNPVQCMQAVWLCACVPSCDILGYLCSDLVTHPLPTVSVTAANIALQLIASEPTWVWCITELHKQVFES